MGTELDGTVCALCLTETTLVDSHVIPRWAYARVRGDEPSFVQMSDGDAFRTSKQATAPLLCAACDGRLGLADEYASRVLRQTDGAFPARDAARTPSARIRGGYDASSLDCDLLALFGASVVWRAHASATFDTVSLGPYGETFRRYLRGEEPFPSSARMIVEFIEPDGTIRGLQYAILAPFSGRVDTFHVHQFLVASARFRLMVGRTLLVGTEEACLVRKRVVAVTDGTEVKQLFLGRAHGATPRGRLSRS